MRLRQAYVYLLYSTKPQYQYRGRGTPALNTAPIPRTPCRRHILGIEVARVLVFLCIKHMGRFYPSAAVHWYTRLHDEPDEDTGMWIVRPAFTGIGRNRTPVISIIHLDTIVRAAHLIGVSLRTETPEELQSHQSLDHFTTFYVNKYVDHHAFELLHEPYPTVSES